MSSAKIALKIARLLTLVFWAFIVWNFIVPVQPASLSKIISIVGIGTFAIHVLEILIFSKRLKIQRNSRKAGFNALIFGMFEILKWRKTTG